MGKFGIVPPEPPIINAVDALAPGFRDRLAMVLADLVDAGWRPVLRETLRTEDRQSWLYGFGRDYDDGRGIVTNAPTALNGWHFFGLAADVGDRRYDAGSEPDEFWPTLERCAVARGLASGADWKSFCDKPHVQFGPPMRATPSGDAVRLYQHGGNAAVWAVVGAAS